MQESYYEWEQSTPGSEHYSLRGTLKIGLMASGLLILTLWSASLAFSHGQNGRAARLQVASLANVLVPQAPDPALQLHNLPPLIVPVIVDARGIYHWEMDCTIHGASGESIHPTGERMRCGEAEDQGNEPCMFCIARHTPRHLRPE